MSWLDKIFNKDAEPSERRMRRLVARTTTPEGRREFLEVMAKHPKLINFCDKNQRSALYHAAAAGDTDTMSRLIDAGIMRLFLHDAIYAAAHSNQQAALDMLLAKGGVVGGDHVEVTMNMAYYYSEPPPEGGPSMTPELEKRYFKAWDMLKAAHAAQEEKRALDAETAKMPGPLVLGDNLSVRGPLKLKAPARREFLSEVSF